MRTTPQDPEHAELEQVEAGLRELFDRKERLQNTIAARRASALIELLKQGAFAVDSYYNVTPLVPKELQNKFDEAVCESSDGFNHFESPLAEQIIFRVDDGHCRIDFRPSMKDDETAKVECDSEFQFKQVVAYLKSIGIKKEQFDFCPFVREIKSKTSSLNDTIRRRDFAASIIEAQ